MLRIVGMPGSPYSRKLRAVLRYRRIPHAWMMVSSPETRGCHARASSSFRSSSCPAPTVRRGESIRAAHPPARDRVRGAFRHSARLRAGVRRRAPRGLRRRVAHEGDVPLSLGLRRRRGARRDDPAALVVGGPAGRDRDRGGKQFAERQVGRLGVVGSNPTTAPVIEESYRRLLALLDARLTGSRFVMGGRPGASDFAPLRPAHPARRLRSDATRGRARDGAPHRRLGRPRRGPLRPRAGATRHGSRATPQPSAPAAPRRGGAHVRAVPPRECRRARARRRTGRMHGRRPAVGAETLPVPGEVSRVAPRGPCGARGERSRRRRRVARRHGCEPLFDA